MVTNLFDTTKIPSGEPTELITGDLVRWRRTDLSDTFDPVSYGLKYSLRKAGVDPQEIEITATSDATGFYVDQSSTDTDNYEPGVYHWQAYITRNSDSERINVDRGRITIIKNLDANDHSDPRTHAEKMVAFLESALEARAGSDVIYYMIGGRAVSKIPPKELRALLADYRAERDGEIAAERRERGLANRNHLTVRFTE